jgi:hypothetical protein
MVTTRDRSASVISISSDDNPIVNKKTGQPIPTYNLISSDEDTSPRPAKKPRLTAPAKPTTSESAPIVNDPRPESLVSLCESGGNENRNGRVVVDEGAQAKLDRLLRSWVDDGIEAAIREGSAAEADKFRK